MGAINVNYMNMPLEHQYLSQFHGFDNPLMGTPLGPKYGLLGPSYMGGLGSGHSGFYGLGGLGGHAGQGHGGYFGLGSSQFGGHGALDPFSQFGGVGPVMGNTGLYGGPNLPYMPNPYQYGQTSPYGFQTTGPSPPGYGSAYGSQTSSAYGPVTPSPYGQPSPPPYGPSPNPAGPGVTSGGPYGTSYPDPYASTYNAEPQQPYTAQQWNTPPQSHHPASPPQGYTGYPYTGPHQPINPEQAQAQPGYPQQPQPQPGAQPVQPQAPPAQPNSEFLQQFQQQFGFAMDPSQSQPPQQPPTTN